MTITDDLLVRGIARAAALSEQGTPCVGIRRERILCDDRWLPNLRRAPYVTVLAPQGDGQILVEVATRIWQAGTRYRRESLDGKPVRLSDGLTGWHIAYYPGEYGYRADDTEPTATVTRRPLPAEQYQIPPVIPTEERDYPQLAAPRTVDHHGRPAVLYTMATSQTDLSPGWSYVLDADSGFLLQAQFRTGPEYREWTDLVIDCDVPDDLFAWHGSSRDRDRD